MDEYKSVVLFTVTLQSKVQTSVFGLGVDFVLTLSTTTPTKIYLEFDTKDQVLFLVLRGAGDKDNWIE